MRAKEQRRWSGGPKIAWAVILVMVLAGANGCRSEPGALGSGGASGGSSAANRSTEGNQSPLTAGELLQRLLFTYRNAQSYRDDGLLRLRYTQAGRTIDDQWPTAVAWKQPNRLAITAYQATVKSNGVDWVAQITDPASRDIDGQVVVRPAPAKIKLADLAADPLLYETLSSQLRRQPIQLELLLESRGLASAFEGDVACRLLEDDDYHGRTCRRVEVPSPAGPFVFWIDPASFLLHRLDYPAAALLPQLGEDPAIEKLELWADLAGARLNPEIAASEFDFTIPAGARRMKSFVRPPQPLPSELFGHNPGEFFFTSLDGKRVGGEQLAGKVAVLCWYYDHPACEATMQQVELARKEFALHPQTVFYAVASDPSSVTGELIEARRQAWKFDLPIVRDWEAWGDKLFRITLQPTIVVLDAKGRVQIFQVGGDAELGKRLTVIIDRLLKGEDLAAEVRRQAEKDQEAYAKLIASGGPEPAPVVEVAEAAIKPASQPKALRLEPRWTNPALKAPGNLLLVNDGDLSQLVVLEGWQNIARIDPSGKLIATEKLALPEQAAITFLRAAVTPQGRVYCGSAPLAPQYFVLDEQFRLLRTVPATLEEPLQIADLQLVDLDGDSAPEVLTANLGLLGVRAFALDGKPQWRNRAAPSVVSLATTVADESGAVSVLALSDQGAVLPINRLGREAQPISTPGRTWLRLVRGDFTASETRSPFLGIAADPQGNLMAVGLTSELRESWSYQLPAGAHARPIEAIASVRDFAGFPAVWCFAGADGTLHLVSEEGGFHDSFAVGAALSGFAIGKLGGEDVVIASTSAGIQSWNVGR